jgi:hypothetical protein
MRTRRERRARERPRELLPPSRTTQNLIGINPSSTEGWANSTRRRHRQPCPHAQASRPRILRFRATRQEDTIHSYCDLLITRLYDQISNNPTIELTSWLNFTTFDIVGDLGFGESFQTLERGKDHPWVAKIFESLKAATFMRPLNAYWPSR